MRLRARQRSLVAALAALGLAVPSVAMAQPAPAPRRSAASVKTAAAPASSAAKGGVAKPPKGDGATSKSSPDAGAADAAAPGGGDDEEDEGELPPGHPDTEQLPAGHPSIEGNPHGAGSRRQAMEANGLFEPLEDGTQNDPSLPPGVLVVTIQDADGKPVPGAPIALSVLHSSVAKGDSREQVSQQADEQGSFRFENLATGAGVTYGFSVSHQGGTFSMPPFPLGAEAGKRATLHVYEVTPSLNNLAIGMQGILLIQLRQDALAIEQLFQVFNLSRVAWQPDLTVPLPENHKAFNKPDSLEEVHFEEVKGTGVALRGTVSPGQHDLNFRYQVPLEEKERQTIRIELPPRMAQVRVIAEASKTMSLDVAGFPAAQRTQTRDGKKVIVTEKTISRADGGLKTLEITLGGLPTPSPSRWVALGLAGVAVLGAVVHTFRRRDELDFDDDARQELFEARNALLDEFVELERARKRGEVGPKTYARIRNALLDALARIVAMIEDAPTAEKAADADRRDGSKKTRTVPASRL